MTKSRGIGRHPPSHRSHGQSFLNGRPTAEYRAWCNMKDRCSRPSAANYARYGGRGISVCEAWAASFEVFLAEMGQRPSPSHSLDRINNDGNYEPGNCRWATIAEQQRNRSRVRLIPHQGRLITIVELAKISGVPYSRLKGRLDRGWSVERAIT